MWLALLVIAGPLAAYLLAMDNTLLFRLDTTDAGVAANLIDSWQYQQRLLEIGEGSFVMHPSFLLDPWMLIVYLLGIPFLIWKIKQGEEGLVAQLLVGVLAFVPVLIFALYVATFLSCKSGDQKTVRYRPCSTIAARRIFWCGKTKPTTDSKKLA